MTRTGNCYRNPLNPQGSRSLDEDLRALYWERRPRDGYTAKRPFRGFSSSTRRDHPPITTNPAKPNIASESPETARDDYDTRPVTDDSTKPEERQRIAVSGAKPYDRVAGQDLT